MLDRHRKLAVASVGAAAAAAAVTGIALSSGGGAPRPSAAGKPASPSAVHQPGSSSYGPGITALAAVRQDGLGYTRPGGRGTVTVASSVYGRPSVLPVIATRAGWVRVRLPGRPNGSTAWLPASDVSLSGTPYRIVIDLATTHLSLYKYGRLVFSVPAGVGTPDDPTPTGEFFVQFDELPPEPNPGYGPFIMVTSAHSDVISDWEGSGDALMGIHGPLGEDAAIGTTGARISHGCVRLHLPALERLADVPPGTPIDIFQR